MSYEPKRFDFSIPVRINLSSDTQTKPTRAMKEAMMAAEVGDEQMGSDPTVWALWIERPHCSARRRRSSCHQALCNEVAIATHCRPGEEILAHESSHILSSEGGAPAAIAGALIKGLTGERGQFSVDALEDAIRPVSRYSPTQRLVEVEQTANRGGGACWSVEALHAVTKAAHAHGLSTHMDGARLMNAAVALGVPASDLAEGCDSVWLDFTKGLAAPLGAVLAGSHEFIGQAWRWKQRLGGSMRQGGMCAAGCIYALEHNIDRLAEDHANAKSLARGMAQIPGIKVEMPETNLVFFDTQGTGMTADAFAGKLRKEGVLVSTSGKYRARACLHLDVIASHVDEALSVMKQVVNAA